MTLLRQIFPPLKYFFPLHFFGLFKVEVRVEILMQVVISADFG